READQVCWAYDSPTVSRAQRGFLFSALRYAAARVGSVQGGVFPNKEMSMAEAQQYQDLVLGSGIGGKLLAWHLARSGRRVAVVERRYIGGSCPNINCVPTKNEVWSAKVADL